MRGAFYMYLVAAIAGAAVAGYMVYLLSSAAQFSDYIKTMEAEREIILAMHISEEIRLFSEKAMDYTINHAVPIALQGGGNPEPGVNNSIPELNGVRYWGWCRDRLTGGVNCDNIDCDYVDINDLASEMGISPQELLEGLMEDGVTYVTQGTLERYAQAFTQRQVHITSITPVEENLAFSLAGGNVSYDAKMQTEVHTLTRGGSRMKSRGLVSSKDDYSASMTSNSIPSIVNEGSTRIGELYTEIENTAQEVDNLNPENSSEWVEMFDDRVSMTSGLYEWNVTLVEFEEGSTCEDVTVRAEITSLSNDYEYKTGSGVEQRPLGMTILMQIRVEKP